MYLDFLLALLTVEIIKWLLTAAVKTYAMKDNKQPEE